MKVSQKVADHVVDMFDHFIPPPAAGTGVPITARIEPEWKYLISRLVQKGHTRFGTENDLVRSALYWYLFEKMGEKFLREHIGDEVGVMQAHVNRAQSLAYSHDLLRFQNTSMDAILKLAKFDMEAAVDFFEETRKVAVARGTHFGKKVRAWLLSDPKLDEVRDAWKRWQKQANEDD